MMYLPKFAYKIFNILVIGIFLCSASASDLYIKSTRLKLNSGNGEVTFSGKVVLWFDDLTLTTESMQIIYKNSTKTKEIDKIIFNNKIAAIKGKADHDQLTLIADNGEYTADKSQLILNGNVKLQQGTNITVMKTLILNMKFKGLKEIKN